MLARGTVCALLACALATSACASIPRGRRGVSSLRVEGMHAMDERALIACMATRSRPELAIDLSPNPSPSCGEAPFDAFRVRAGLFSWPWTDWPLYDRTVFERDVERIERWYRARGYYDATVVSTEVTPPDTADPVVAPVVQLLVHVEEGEPVHVVRTQLEIAWSSEDGPPDESVRAELRAVVARLHRARFDEAEYDHVKEELGHALRERGYARVQVHGEVRVDPEEHAAEVALRVDTGPPCRLGDITVTVTGEETPEAPILVAARLATDQPYAQSAITDAQRYVYALGAFTSVEVEPILDSDEVAIDVIPVRIRVTTGRLVRFGAGLGVQFGQPLSSPVQSSTSATNQWDVHALGFFEHRNLFGGLRRFRAEVRPRLVFTPAFPQAPDRVTPGLLVTLDFRQPAFLDPATTLLVGARYDYGPDPYDRGFARHDIDAWLGPQRSFLSSRLQLTATIHGAGLAPEPFTADNQAVPAGYGILFFEQLARLDLRDDPNQPRQGFYASLGAMEAPFEIGQSWQYVRVLGDLRAYVALPLGVTIAARYGMGAVFVLSEFFDASVNPRFTSLGPDSYRLRGGGANDNRGFPAGQLGGYETSLFGGQRSWTASLEVRTRITESIGLTFFADVGDVNSRPEWRFGFLNLSLGLGLRYRTVVGPIRADFAVPIPGAQVPGQEGLYWAPASFFGLAGMLHLTIGEAW